MSTMEKQLPVEEKSDKKTQKLFFSILFDLLGMVTFIVPVLGETFDVIWAPIAGFLLNRMYKGTVGKVGGVIVFIEELMPGLDFIPTFTLTWIYTYYFKK